MSHKRKGDEPEGDEPKRRRIDASNERQSHPITTIDDVLCIKELFGQIAVSFKERDIFGTKFCEYSTEATIYMCGIVNKKWHEYAKIYRIEHHCSMTSAGLERYVLYKGLFDYSRLYALRINKQKEINKLGFFSSFIDHVDSEPIRMLFEIGHYEWFCFGLNGDEKAADAVNVGYNIVEDESFLNGLIVGGHLDKVRSTLSKKAVPYTDRRLIACVVGGSLDILKYFMPDEQNFDSLAFKYACQYGRLEIAKQLLKPFWHNTKLHKYFMTQCMCEAAKSDHLDVIEYIDGFADCKFQKVAEIAARYSSSKCLKYAIDKGATLTDKVLEEISQNGDLECFEFVYQNGKSLTSSAFERAVRTKSMELVKYLEEMGYPIPDSACTISARFGNLECLKYFRLKGYTMARALRTAIKWAHKDCIDYCLNRGCVDDGKAMPVFLFDGGGLGWNMTSQERADFARDLRRRSKDCEKYLKEKRKL